MFDPKMQLLSTVLATAAVSLASDPTNEAPWAEALAALASTRAEEPELARILDARDHAALTTLVAEWQSGKRHLPLQDREVLKRALKAYRKSLKVTQLDAESSIGGGPMSSGRSSGILGMRPPDRYPRAVWDELARQRRLIYAGQGLYELPPGDED
ncbi:MAG: hypothetical protein NTY35_03165 [Planctomycetota bacterium]|nr:hypothetical protein [Planctomycetota bacterium]